MWLILQQEQPEDFVIATGVQHSVREFAQLAFHYVGIELQWEGKAEHEKGICVSGPDVGKAPQEEHARDQCEGDGVASVDRFHHFTMPFSRYSARFMRTLAAAPSEATFAMS